MIDLNKLDVFTRKPGNSLLGLALDGSRLEGVHVRRTNGSVEVRKSFSTLLSLDPLTAEVELVGREIRKQLDTEQIKERWCTVCLPLSWALTMTVKLPELADADIPDFLAIEAERGFPYSPDELMVAHSLFRTANGERAATLVAIPREQVVRLDAVLQAAQLRPVTFSLGLPALQRPENDPTEGVLAFLPGESSIGMQLSTGGGVVLLRTLDGAFEQAGPERELQGEHIAREIRITLGQLQPEIRESVKRLRVFGRNETAVELTEELQTRTASMGVKVEHVRDHATEEYGVKVPPGIAVSAALSLAVARLAGHQGMEFLPPKISAWKQFSQRYSSGKVAYAGMAAGAVAVLVALMFLVQQLFLWHWQSKWSGISGRVTELTDTRDQIRRYRPWYDDSVRTLNILRRITQAFPVDGAVSAKSVELREPATVTCTGTALNRDAFLKVVENLRQAKEISGIHNEYLRGGGPVEFSVTFQWGGGGGQ